MNKEKLLNRITINPNVLVGKPEVKSLKLYSISSQIMLVSCLDVFPCINMEGFGLPDGERQT